MQRVPRGCLPHVLVGDSPSIHVQNCGFCPSQMKNTYQSNIGLSTFSSLMGYTLKIKVTKTPLITWDISDPMKTVSLFNCLLYILSNHIKGSDVD